MTSSNPPVATPAARERAIKRQILGQAQSATIHFPKGFGDAVQAEATALLARGLQQPQFVPRLELGPTGLAVTGIGFRDLLALASLMTTAREILWPIASGRAGGIGELKAKLQGVPWELYLAKGTALSLRVNSLASRVYHEGKIEELLTEALQTYGCSVPAAADASEQKLDLRLEHDRLSLSLSFGGRPLHQRRYKVLMQGLASVKEDIAAAAVQTAASFMAAQSPSQAEPPTDLVMPFAGSGTLGFEAYMHFAGVPPWVFFGPLAAAAWLCTPATTLRFIHKQSLAGAGSSSPRLHFIDNDAAACAGLAVNAGSFNAGLVAQGLSPAVITVSENDVFTQPDWPIDKDARVFVGLNPPFGRRLGDKSSVDRLYPRLADTLNHGPVWLAGFLFSPSLAVAERFGQRLRGFRTAVASFNHGGRTVYLTLFARTPPR